MATPTPASFQAFITNVETMIGQVYNEDMVDLIADKITTTLPCTSQQMVLGWTGLIPKMRPWFGPRVVNEAAPQTYTIVPLPYENTLAIDRFTLEDDQFGVLYRELPDMARQARRQKDYETRDLLEATGAYAGSVVQLGFDGLPHWNTAHPVNVYNPTQGTYANDFTGGGFTIGGTLIGGALGPTAFATLLQYAQTIKGEDNEVLGVTPSMMMVPTELRITAEYILKAMFLAPPAYGAFQQVSGQVGASDNMLRRMGVDLIVNKFLNNQTRWYLLDLTKAFKPFLWVVRNAVTMTPRVNENDPNVFDSHMFMWGQWNRVTPAWDYEFLSFRSGT